MTTSQVPPHLPPLGAHVSFVRLVWRAGQVTPVQDHGTRCLNASLAERLCMPRPAAASDPAGGPSEKRQVPRTRRPTGLDRATLTRAGLALKRIAFRAASQRAASRAHPAS
jgi:hypothetical protein